MKTFTRYLGAISRINQLGEGSGVQWLFYPGMLFLSMDKWWDDWRFRPLRHEGIDICWYRTAPGEEISCFDTSTRIPAFEDGIVLNICNDFLGKTLVIQGPDFPTPERPVLYTYAHITPVQGMTIGSRVTKNQVIATVCDTHKNPQLPPHLHFSCFEPLGEFHARTLDWSIFSDIQKVNMLPPLFL